MKTSVQCLVSSAWKPNTKHPNTQTVTAMTTLLVDSKLIPEIDLVVFDKDGTLIELYHYWSQMVALRARLICEALGLGNEHEAGLRWSLGVDEKAGRLRPEGPVGLKKREIVIKAATDYLDGVGRRDTLRICEQAFERADEISSRDLGGFIRPIGGAVSLLRSLHDRGCRVALATVDVSRRARLAMEFMGVSERARPGGRRGRGVPLETRPRDDPSDPRPPGGRPLAGRHGRRRPQRRSDGRATPASRHPSACSRASRRPSRCGP